MCWAARQQVFAVHLDDLFREPGGFDKKSSREEVLCLIHESIEKDQWIVEGVFGELAELYLDSTDLLIWLDTDWSICRERLGKRGSERKMHMNREQSEGGQRQLVELTFNHCPFGNLSLHGLVTPLRR